MSEAMEECFKCLNNNECYSGASYNSIYCKSHRKYNFDKVEETKCLHCGSGVARYCEECYQKLIGANAKLQVENKELEAEKEGYKSDYYHIYENSMAYIHTSKIETKLEDYEERKRYYSDNNIENDEEYIRIEAKIEAYRELLKEGK